MGKLFGTDGIRGVANETLDAKLAYRVGQAAAISLADDSGTKPTVVIGKDTRISSDMLEGALVAGLTACGCNAILLGVIPTPAVAYLTVYLHADAGVVISASHNPYEHNGIKMFSSEGFKLSDALEARIEELILREGELPVKTHGQIGQVMSGSFAAEYYLDHLASTVEDLEPLRVLIDCANGAASTTARYLFGRFPLEAEYLNDKPNGVNINNGCGSTHLESLAEGVVDVLHLDHRNALDCLIGHGIEHTRLVIDRRQTVLACNFEHCRRSLRGHLHLESVREFLRGAGRGDARDVIELLFHRLVGDDEQRFAGLLFGYVEDLRAVHPLIRAHHRDPVLPQSQRRREEQQPDQRDDQREDDRANAYTHGEHAQIRGFTFSLALLEIHDFWPGGDADRTGGLIERARDQILAFQRPCIDERTGRGDGL